MRIAIITDIHSNRQALEAVFENAEGRSLDKFFCLGDIVGYGSSPKQCLDWVRNRCEGTVFGNHEYALLFPEHSKTFNPDAKKAIEYSKTKLAEEDIMWLLDLEPRLFFENITFAHGSIRDFDEYVSDPTIARFSLETMQSQLLFVGHTHYPGGYNYDLETRSVRTMELYGDDQAVIEDGCRYLINPGSVGQPRDGDPRASYAIYDTEKSLVQIIRVKYDIGAAAEGIKAAGLSDYLAKRLYAGR